MIFHAAKKDQTHPPKNIAGGKTSPQQAQAGGTDTQDLLRVNRKKPIKRQRQEKREKLDRHYFQKKCVVPDISRSFDDVFANILIRSFTSPPGQDNRQQAEDNAAKPHRVDKKDRGDAQPDDQQSSDKRTDDLARVVADAVYRNRAHQTILGNKVWDHRLPGNAVE